MWSAYHMKFFFLSTRPYQGVMCYIVSDSSTKRSSLHEYFSSLRLGPYRYVLWAYFSFIYFCPSFQKTMKALHLFYVILLDYFAIVIPPKFQVVFRISRVEEAGLCRVVFLETYLITDDSNSLPLFLHWFLFDIIFFYESFSHWLRIQISLIKCLYFGCDWFQVRKMIRFCHTMGNPDHSHNYLPLTIF